VIVGAIFDGHLTETGQATVLAVPSATNCITNEHTLGEAGVLVKVNDVILVVREILNKLPVDRSKDMLAAVVGWTRTSVKVLACRFPSADIFPVKLKLPEDPPGVIFKRFVLTLVKIPVISLI
jgi:hypothetical protein